MLLLHVMFLLTMQSLYYTTATVLSRFNDIILARVFSHSDIDELTKYSTVPGKIVL